MRKWKTLCAGIFMSIALLPTAAANGTVPYENYTYSESDGSVIQGPQAYVPEQIVFGGDLGIGNIMEATDLDEDENDHVYLLDGGAGQVIVTNSNFKMLRRFQGFDNQGHADTFEGARGIFVDDALLYIADTGHQRVVILDKQTGLLQTIVGAPTASIMGEGFLFKPIRLVADADRMLYIVSEGTYEGMINLDWDGNFIGFFGGNQVEASVWDIFWQRFSSRELRKSMTQFVPQDHSSVDIDHEGFFLVTSYTSQRDRMVKRLNPGGDDVIRNLSRTPLTGDPGLYWEQNAKVLSSFVDVAGGPQGMYLCLDSTHGRLFCYNNDGYLLYTFGGKAARNGGFTQPSGVIWLSDGRVAVTDTARKSITVFKPTEYALEIQNGIAALNEFQYDKANSHWRKVLGMNSQFELGQREMGKVYLNEKKYQMAMEAFRKASDKTLYSRALGAFRSDWIYRNATVILAAAVFLVAGGMLAGRMLRRRRKRNMIP